MTLTGVQKYAEVSAKVRQSTPEYKYQAVQEEAYKADLKSVLFSSLPTENKLPQ